LTTSRCATCGLQASGASGLKLANLSVAADAALKAGSSAATQLLNERSALIATLLGAPAPPPMPFAQPFPQVPPVPYPGPAPWPPAAAKPASQWTPTTALALVGALLVAASAVGFAFFIPDLGWSARVISLAVGAVAAGAGALFLKLRQMTSTAEAVAGVAAALALLTWTLAIGDIQGRALQAGSSGVSLFVLAALIYLAGRLGLRAWRMTGLLAAPFAAVFLPAWALGDRPHYGAENLLVAAIAAIVFALIAALGRKIEDGRLERALLAVMGAGALAVAGLAAVGTWADPLAALIWLLVAPTALALGQERRARWLPASGVALVLAGAELVFSAFELPVEEAWSLGLFGALAVWLLCAVAARLAPAPQVTGPLAAGAFLGLLAISLPTLAFQSFQALLGVPASFATPSTPEIMGWSVPAAAAALTALVRSPLWLRRAAGWAFLPAGAACLACWVALPDVPPGWAFATLALASLGLSGIAAGAVLAPGRRPRFNRYVAVSARAAAFALALPLALVCVDTDPLLAVGALVVPAAVLATGFSLRPTAWPVLTAVACVPFATLAMAALERYTDGPAPFSLLTIIVCLAVAVLTTFPRPAPRTWSVLAVFAAALFGVTAVDLLFDRTWTGMGGALSMTVLALTAALVRRRALPLAVKVLATAVAVGSLALTMVTTLALLTPGSGSVWLFPLVAVVSAAAAMGGLWLRRPPAPTPVPAGVAERRGVGAALIVSGGAVGLIAVLMAVGWPVTGATTVLATAALACAASAGVAAARAGSAHAWWYSGAMACVVLWSALVLGDVGLVEAYTLPPALAAAGIGGALAHRHRSMLALAVPGAWLAVAPSLILEFVGTDPLLRGLELAALGVLALALAASFEHLRRAFGLVALAPVAGLVNLALMVGRVPPFPDELAVFRPLQPYPSALFAIAALIGVAAAAGLALTGGLFARRTADTRLWVFGAFALAAAVPVCSMRFTWFVVAAMWLAMTVFLGLTFWSARPGRPSGLADGGLPDADGAPRALPGSGGRLALPPFWSIWLVALAVGIAGWSTRQLRVEVFALPLGLALFAAGWAVRGWLGSRAWAVTPGVAATLGPSTLAVGTDPLTWRAIMVLVLALAFMVLGALRRWRPPTFVAAGSIGVTVFEVFARSGEVSAVPWLASLLATGGCLLALAIYFELRSRRDAAAADGC
jgi:hypothetical protein